MKDGIIDETMSVLHENINYFSSRSRIDSSINDKIHQANHSSNIFGFCDKNKVNPDSETLSHTPTRQKSKIKRAKRGASLERDIAKVIISEEPKEHKANLEKHDSERLSPEDIISDIIASHESNLYHNGQFQGSNFHYETTEECFEDDKTGGRIERKESSDFSSEQNLFDFKTEDCEWAAFDESSMFVIQPEPLNELDDNGFPVACKTRNDEKQTTNVNVEFTLKRDTASPKIELMVEMENEVVVQSAETGSHFEPPSIVSCDDKSIRSESKISLLPLSDSSKSCSNNFESTKFPSIANFILKKKSNDPNLAAPCERKIQCNDLPVPVSKLSWTPNPPKHSKHSYGVL